MRLFGGMGISIGLGVMVNEYCVVGLEFKWNFTSALFVVGNDNIRFSSVQLRSGPFLHPQSTYTISISLQSF